MLFKELFIYSLLWIAPNERESDYLFMFFEIRSDSSDSYPKISDWHFMLIKFYWLFSKNYIYSSDKLFSKLIGIFIAELNFYEIKFLHFSTIFSKKPKFVFGSIKLF